VALALILILSKTKQWLRARERDEATRVKREALGFRGPYDYQNPNYHGANCECSKCCPRR
jgi:hypothetical protein